MLIEMKVATVTVDPFTNMPILILQDLDGRTLPIYIGAGEASAIAASLESIQLDRPMTHDLMKSILGLCAIQVERVEVHDLKNQTFFATIFLSRPDGTKLAVDARPSDAVALAMRARAPIFVAKKVIEKARKLEVTVPLPVEAMPVDAPELGELAKTAFGKWKM